MAEIKKNGELVMEEEVEAEKEEEEEGTVVEGETEEGGDQSGWTSTDLPPELTTGSLWRT